MISGTERGYGKPMSDDGHNGRDTVYFVSDAHFGLGADERTRVRLFGELMAEARRRGAALYVVGDLFDFWIEYRFAIRPDYFPVLHELRSLVEAGVEVHYLAGNHDFALGPFLEEAVGISVHSGCVDAQWQGRRLHISHGHRANKNKTLRIAGRFLRCKLLQTLYRTIHPNIGVRLGAFCSAMSKKACRRRGGTSAKSLERYRLAAQARLRTGKNDLVVYAHTHRRELVSLDGGEYCNIGSWIEHYDYAILRDGRIQLRKWGNNAS
jgi:UDP-2,3-diacylglucosamine hydrolase